jgi:glycosyltransferase involved in cell wall biosynthesis
MVTGEESEPKHSADVMTALAMHPSSNIDVLILAKNEERNLPWTLASVVPFARKVFVVDSGSSDRTQEIAESWGATFVRKEWLGYAKQKNWALDTLPLTGDWTLIVDADEAVLPELRDEMMAIASEPANAVREAGFYVNRYFIFLGKRIRHCGYYPSWNLRFFKRGKARYEERDVHEHMIADGPTAYLKGHLEHYDRNGLERYMEKHNRYSTLEAREIVRRQRLSAQERAREPEIGGPIAFRRFIKNNVYAWLPAKWLFRFLFMYVARLGFLDGVTGFRFCLFISAYEMLIGLKITELQREAHETVPSPPQSC